MLCYESHSGFPLSKCVCVYSHNGIIIGECTTLLYGACSPLYFGKECLDFFVGGVARDRAHHETDLIMNAQRNVDRCIFDILLMFFVLVSPSLLMAVNCCCVVPSFCCRFSVSEMCALWSGLGLIKICAVTIGGQFQRADARYLKQPFHRCRVFTHQTVQSKTLVVVCRVRYWNRILSMVYQVAMRENQTCYLLAGIDRGRFVNVL